MINVENSQPGPSKGQHGNYFIMDQRQLQGQRAVPISAGYSEAYSYKEDLEDFQSLVVLMNEFQKVEVSGDVGRDDSSTGNPQAAVDTDETGDDTSGSPSYSPPSPLSSVTTEIEDKSIFEFMAGVSSERTSTPLPSPSSSSPSEAAGVEEDDAPPASHLMKSDAFEPWQIPCRLDHMTETLVQNHVEYPHYINKNVSRESSKWESGIGLITPDIILGFLHELREMQDLLMIGDEMDIETRRNLCSRAANLEQEYLEYFYYEAAPTQPHSFASRIPKVKVEAKAGEVDLNGNQRGHEGQAATVTFENRNGSMWLGAAETVEGAASTIINFSDPRPSHSVSTGETSTILLHPPPVTPETWSGILPAQHLDENTIYSCKVFLGGLPSDLTDECIIHRLLPFGQVEIERLAGSRVDTKNFAYAIFDREEAVHRLLRNCCRDVQDPEKWFIYMTSDSISWKSVEVVPWSLANNKYSVYPSPNPHTKEEEIGETFTVFVGAVHGTLNAEGLCFIMQILFGGVLRTRIDTDRYQYPIGSGQVVFHNYRSYFAAVSAQFLDIKTPKFRKILQVDPYLTLATVCKNCRAEGTLFCRDAACFRSYCYSCYHQVHKKSPENTHRSPLLRRPPTHQQVPNSGPPPTQQQLPFNVPHRSIRHEVGNREVRIRNRDVGHSDIGQRDIGPPPGFASFQRFPPSISMVCVPAPNAPAPRIRLGNACVKGTAQSHNGSASGSSSERNSPVSRWTPRMTADNENGSNGYHHHHHHHRCNPHRDEQRGQFRGGGGWRGGSPRGFRFPNHVRPRQIFRQ